VNIDESVDVALAKISLISSKQTSPGAEVTMAFKKSVVLIGTPGNFANLLRSDNLQI